MDADTLLTETETIHEQTADYLRDSAHLFHDHEGELFTHEQAIELLSTDLDIDSSVAQKVLTQLVGDHVDPVIQVNDDGTKYIGVAEFHEFDGAYGYVTHHDLHGKSKCVVCQQCVNCVTTDSAVTHVAEHELTDSVDTDVGWSELLAPIHDHYQSHAVAPTDVDTSVEATGATLKSGTTIGGNLAFHKGNDGPESGLDADSLHGNGPGEFVTTKYTDAEAASASPVQSVNGETGAVTVDGITKHFNLTGINPDDHHVKYTDNDARNAVSGSGIDGSSFSGVVKNKYTDGEAKAAVSGSSIDGSNFTGVGAGDAAQLRLDRGSKTHSYDFEGGVEPCI